MCIRDRAYTADITDIKRSENEVSCAVIKDGGDDPDVTTGAYILSLIHILLWYFYLEMPYV